MMNNQNSILNHEAKEALLKLKKLQHDPSWVMFCENPCRQFKMHIGNRLLSKGELVIHLPMETLVSKLAS